MNVGMFYLNKEKYLAALRRYQKVIDEHSQSKFTPEALHRLVEVYYKLGLVEESRKAAAILGYNYKSSQWYERSYKVFNKKYKPKRIKKETELGFLRRKIKSLFE